MTEVFRGGTEVSEILERLRTAQIDAAESLFDRASKDWDALGNSPERKTEETYSRKLQSVLDRIAQAYRLAYDSADLSSNPPNLTNKTWADALIMKIGLLCQKHAWEITVQPVKFSGQNTVRVSITVKEN